MVVTKCIGMSKYDNGEIKEYSIQGQHNEIKNIKTTELIKALKNKELYIINLILHKKDNITVNELNSKINYVLTYGKNVIFEISNNTAKYIKDNKVKIEEQYDFSYVINVEDFNYNNKSREEQYLLHIITPDGVRVLNLDIGDMYLMYEQSRFEKNYANEKVDKNLLTKKENIEYLQSIHTEFLVKDFFGIKSNYENIQSLKVEFIELNDNKAKLYYKIRFHF